MIRKRVKGKDDDRIYWLIKHVLYPMAQRSNPGTKCIRSELINRLNLGNTFVKANDQGEVAGFIHFFCASEPAWIDMLAVHPQARQSGIGSELMIKAQMEALKQGAGLISLYVDEQNKVGIRFYEKHGFHAVRYIPQHKCYQMSKRID